MNPHMLSKVVVSTEVLAASGVWAFVRYSMSEDQLWFLSSRYNDLRLSLVWILLMCLFKCSPLAKRFMHPSTSHMYVRVFCSGQAVSIRNGSETD